MLAEQSIQPSKDGCVDEAIAVFKQADLNLRIAIEEDAHDGIVAAAQCSDGAIDALLNVQTSSPAERKKLYQFLMNRFVLDENSSRTLRNRVCDKVLAEL